MEKRIVIVGGGLAGLSAGCYALASGFRTTIVEHNLALGGVCTAWTRGPYTIDGCIQWLTGGPFARLYEELGILPRVKLHVLERFATYRDAALGGEVTIGRDLDALARALDAIAPEDHDEIRRMIDAASMFATMDPDIDHPPELSSMRDGVRRIWGLRSSLGALVHFRKPIGQWSREFVASPRLHRFFARLMPLDAPAFFLLMVLGYLQRGWLSRPDGGTGPFRDALIDEYRRLGGEERVHATVDEILVDADGRAYGVRLADGELLDADVVISTASAPETILRLLGGRFGATELRQRLERWKLVEPIVLTSFGVEDPLASVPQTLIVDGVAPFPLCGRSINHLHLRIYNDDPKMAPAGHTVLQATVESSYEWWATRGVRYAAEKDVVAERLLEAVAEHVPRIVGKVRVTDVATPLTFWNMARSWRGAFEGWAPNHDSFFGHVSKTLPGLSKLYMAGQWVEPGGGVPTAIMSGRQVVQLVCAEEGRAFAAPTRGEPPFATVAASERTYA
jgi:phytoene dehydrogenase-like protein